MVDDLHQQESKRDDRDEKGRFIPGMSGNPKGRPKGSRDQLEYDFINAVQREFATRGERALADLDAKSFCDIAVKCLPKESRMEIGEHFADLLTRAADVLAQRDK